MATYQREDARAWAREHLTGCAAVTLPSFSADLVGLNERGIRHDVGLAVELGYSYTLLCADVGITPEENAQFTRWARDTGGGRIGLFFHAAFGSLDADVEAVKLAERAGADIALFTCPGPGTTKGSEQAVYEVTRAFCDSTRLAVMLMVHPVQGGDHGMPLSLLRRLLKDCPNIAALRPAHDDPSVAALCELYHHFRDDVVISGPLDGEVLPLMSVMRLQFCGPHSAQWMGDHSPKAFALACRGRWDEAMSMYWKASPARGAQRAAAAKGPSNALWKYRDWLAGFNGGPLRSAPGLPADRSRRQLRQGLRASAMPVTGDPDSAFLLGRHPG